MEVKILEVLERENQELKQKMKLFSDSKCSSINCKKTIDSLQNQVHMYLEEIIKLKESKKKKLVKDTGSRQSKKKFKLKKKKTSKIDQKILAKPFLKKFVKIKIDKILNKEENSDDELESILMNSLSKLNEAKTLLRELKDEQKPSKPIKPKPDFDKPTAFPNIFKNSNRPK